VYLDHLFVESSSEIQENAAIGLNKSDKACDRRSRQSQLPKKMTVELVDLIKEKLEERFISHESIYRYIP
jgi:hypothetical protein